MQQAVILLLLFSPLVFGGSSSHFVVVIFPPCFWRLKNKTGMKKGAICQIRRKRRSRMTGEGGRCIFPMIKPSSIIGTTTISSSFIVKIKKLHPRSCRMPINDTQCRSEYFKIARYATTPVVLVVDNTQ